MTDIPTNGAIWLAKVAGAVAGSAISLAYLLPHSRRDAAIRFLTGITAGLVFGTTVGIAIADHLSIGDVLSDVETVLMGAAVASLTIWWAMGVALRVADRRTGSNTSRDGARNPSDAEDA